MEAVIVLDHEASTAVSEDLEIRLSDALRGAGYRTELVPLRRADAAPCRGCLLCLTQHPGQCITRDLVGEMMRRMHLDRDACITVFLTPVRFGHPSSVIKNAQDRGTGSHRLQVIIGYGEDIDLEEESTFIDITEKHCGAADIVHPGMVSKALAFVTRSTEDNAAICAALEERL